MAIIKLTLEKLSAWSVFTGPSNGGRVLQVPLFYSLKSDGSVHRITPFSSSGSGFPHGHTFELSDVVSEATFLAACYSSNNPNSAPFAFKADHISEGAEVDLNSLTATFHQGA